MSYANIADPLLRERGRLPNSATLLTDPGQWITSLPTQPVEVQRSTGWYVVADVARPADTPTTTWDRSLTLVAGVPTVTWTERAKTQAELDAATAAANSATLTANPEQQVTDLLAAIETLRAKIGTQGEPAGTTSLRAMKQITNANILTAQNLKALIDLDIDVAIQTRIVARQLVKMLRLQLGELDSTDTGTA